MSRSVSAISLLVPDYHAGIAFYVGKPGFSLVEDTPLDDGKRRVLVSPDNGAQTRLLLARAADSAQQAAIGNQAGGRVPEDRGFRCRLRTLHRGWCPVPRSAAR